MCTLIVIREPGRLRIGANRDERLDRPAGPPRPWTLGERRALAPIDLEAGGTWIGVNDRGVFAALTNRYGVSKRDGVPSRGRWVPRMLGFDSAAAAARDLRGQRPRENGFHLVVADGQTAVLAIHDGETLRVDPLGFGPTVITERSLGAQIPPREAWIAQLLAARGTGRDVLVEALDRRRDDAPLDGVRVLAEDLGYGTRSSTLIELTEGGRLRFEFAERYPREEAYRDVSGRLGGASSPFEVRR